MKSILELRGGVSVETGDFSRLEEREKKRGSEFPRLTGKAWCAEKEGRGNDLFIHCSLVSLSRLHTTD
jgi:hypothetical protein